MLLMERSKPNIDTKVLYFIFFYHSFKKFCFSFLSFFLIYIKLDDCIEEKNNQVDSAACS